MKLGHQPKVALYDQFLDSFARIPRAQQKKVMTFLRKFREQPTSESINYEKIRDFVDPNLRTVRIDDAYRAIVLHPERGDVYVLLWVDHHDEAMAWARNKRCAVHPETGSLQILSVDSTRAPPPTVAPAARPLFARWTDADLATVGVPAALVPTVRALTSVEQLTAVSGTFPADVHEALHFLADGESLDEVRRAMEIAEPVTVPADDFAAALTTDSTRRSFALVESDDALAAMLDAPLERWRVFLHPSQRRLVEGNKSGPVRVLGGAGTGKTVVAMHRAAWLVRQPTFGDDDRILFTTFTKNLAGDIHENLKKLCTPRELRHIEVEPLDRWVTNFLRQQGYRYEIDYWQEGDGRLWDLWDRARAQEPQGFPEGFLREEWDYVVQPEAITMEEAYLTVARKGRGLRLSRPQRRELWKVFAAYRDLLEEKGLKESVDALRDATALLRSGKVALPYRSVLVDEAQDFSSAAYELLRAMVPPAQNDLFIVGDAHQRIYRRQAVLGRAGIDVRGRGRRLRVNYRTTEEIRRFAVAVLEGVAVDDLDGGEDSLKGYRSLVKGEAPRLLAAGSFEDEIAGISAFVREGDANRSCLVARTARELGRYAVALEGAGVSVYQLKRSEPEDRSREGLRLATMHRVKGLEFDRVIVVGEMRASRSNDVTVREDDERQERALRYVALTRARRAVLATPLGR